MIERTIRAGIPSDPPSMKRLFHTLLAWKARFMLEQPLLAKKATGIAGEPAVRSDDPMARHNNSDRIRAVRGAHRPTCAVFTDVAGELAVADCGSRWNGRKRSPDSTLEWRAASGSFDARENVDAAGKIGIEGLREGTRCWTSG